MCNIPATNINYVNKFSLITMRNINLPSNLVSQGFGWDDGDFFADPLVDMEIQSQTSVVFLDDDLSGLLDGLGTYTTLNSEDKHIFHEKQIPLLTFVKITVKSR